MTPAPGTDDPAVRAALVTGASRGIGLGIAELLAAQGHHLTISARDTASLEPVAARLRELGAPGVLTVAADMADDDAVAELATRHVDAFGWLDAIVLAAGVGTAAPLAATSEHRWDKQFDVNVRAPFRLVRMLLPVLRRTAAESGRGANVVALSSIGGVYPEPGLGAYGASKAALVALCRSLNVEESGHGVTATAICPAYVDTDMSAWMHEQVPAAAMITVADVVALVRALLQLSPNAVVSQLVVSRAGTDGHRA